MTYKIHIQRNSDKEIRKYTMKDWDWTDDYIWTEGNYSCDCNLHLFFERAIGNEPIMELGGKTCGFDKYTPLKAELEDGQIIELCEEYKVD